MILWLPLNFPAVTEIFLYVYYWLNFQLTCCTVWTNTYVSVVVAKAKGVSS